MTTATYAPGPWKEYDRNDLGDIYLGDADGLAVAIVLQAQFPEMPERVEANARLIAAAPDLLVACKAWLDGGNYQTGELWHIVTSAVAKAEGRS